MKMTAPIILKSIKHNMPKLSCILTSLQASIPSERLLRGVAGVLIGTALLWNGVAQSGAIAVPNYSFESPAVPPVSPYAGPDVDYWQKSAQPVWYNPTNNNNTPWSYLMGCFYNVMFPGQFIDNCDGSQAAFLFAVPEAALFQDYNSIYGTNTIPSHAFNAKFNVGSSYDLTVGLIGGGGGMQPGVTLELSLYYRDASSNMVTVVATSVTNSVQSFPTNTHFVDFQVHVPVVKTADAWAGQNIGIQLLSTADFTSAGGYWDVDNVRLTETPTATLSLSNPVLAKGQFSFTVVSQPGVQFEIQVSTNIFAAPSDWIRMATFTNVTGVMPVTDTTTNSNQHYYRARQL
jgi:hapalindole biogenesis HpiC1 cyclase-like protein